MRFAYGREERRDFISPSEVVKCSGFILLVLVFYFCTPDASGSVYKDCFPKLFKKFWLWTLIVVWTLRLLKNARVFRVIQNRLRPSVFRFHSPHSGGMLTDTLNELSDCGPKDSVSLTAIGVVVVVGVTLLVILAVHILQSYRELWCWHICLFVFIYKSLCYNKFANKTSHSFNKLSHSKKHLPSLKLCTPVNFCTVRRAILRLWLFSWDLHFHYHLYFYTLTPLHKPWKSWSSENLFIFPFMAEKFFLYMLSLLITLTFAHLFGVYLSQYAFSYLGPFWFHRTYRVFYYYESDFYSPVCLNLLLRLRVHTMCAHNCMLIMSEPGIFMWMGIALNLHTSLSSVVIFTIHLNSLFYYFYFMCV